MVTADPADQGNLALNKKPSLKDRLPKLPLVVWLIVLFISAIVISAGIYIAINPDISLKSLFSRLTGTQKGPENIWEPAKPTPRPLAHGKQTYVISGSKKGAPKPTEVAIDPLDPAQGASQSATAKVLSMEAGPVTKVSVDIITDNKTKTYPLQLTSGTDLEGVWSGTWVMEDSFDYKYQMTIIAENANDSWTVTLTFR